MERFNATREQWRRTWRDARVLASQGREPGRYHDRSLIWEAFIIAAHTRHEPMQTTARQRLMWKRMGELDIPF